MFKQYLEKHFEIIENEIKSGLIVYKGFPWKFFEYISIKLPHLSNQKIFNKDNKLDLDLIDKKSKDLLKEAISFDNMSWITFEEFTIIAQNFNPDLFDFKITVFINDLFNEWFPNPSNYEFPDQLYEIENQNSFNPPDLFNKFYTGSKIVDDVNYICYPNLFSDDSIVCKEIEFFKGICKEIEIEYIPFKNQEVSIIELPSPDDRLLLVKTDFYNNTIRQHYNFLIQKKSVSAGKDKFLKHFTLLYSIAHDLGIDLKVFVKPKEEVNKTREEYLKILDKYWGTKNFRELLFYQNPETNNDKIKISQDQIIEYLVMQSEFASNGKRYQDVFITAPTGSGKSLLFQIPAIYMAEKQNLVTIIVSPLKALMYDQVEALNDRGVDSACYINSDISF